MFIVSYIHFNIWWLLLGQKGYSFKSKYNSFHCDVCSIMLCLGTGAQARNIFEVVDENREDFF